MNLIKSKAHRIFGMLKTQSNINEVEAQLAIKNYKDGKANENRTIKELKRIYDKEILYVCRMRKILKNHFPECEEVEAKKVESVLFYIAQYI